MSRPHRRPPGLLPFLVGVLTLVQIAAAGAALAKKKAPTTTTTTKAPTSPTTTTTVSSTTTTANPTTSTTLLPATTTSTTVATPTTVPPSGTHVVPTSIPADCSRPVEAELLAFFASVPNGSTIVFGENACYAHNDELSVNDRANLTFDGRGSTFKAVGPIATNDHAAACGQGNWRIRGGVNIHLVNMTVVGRNTPAPHGFDNDRMPYTWGVDCAHAYSFESTQGGGLRNVEARDSVGYSANVGSDGRRGDFCAVPPARDIVVTDSKFWNSQRTVAVTNGQRITLSRNYVAEMYDAGIDLEPNVPCEWARDITITDNRFGRTRFGAVAFGGPGDPSHVGNITISGNVMEEYPATCYVGVIIDPSHLYGNYGPDDRVGGVSITRNRLKVLGDGVFLRTAVARVEDNHADRAPGSGCLPLGGYPDGGGSVFVSLAASSANVIGNTWTNDMTAEWRLDDRSSVTSQRS